MDRDYRPTFREPNYVVARYRNGTMIKGITYNFNPRRKSMNVISFKEEAGWEKVESTEVFFAHLKAVFFVKSLEGRKGRIKASEADLQEKLDSTRMTKVKVTFADGETLVGVTTGYSPDRIGFFVLPLEEDSNNIRIFVITDAVTNVEVWR